MALGQLAAAGMAPNSEGALNCEHCPMCFAGRGDGAGADGACGRGAGRGDDVQYLRPLAMVSLTRVSGICLCRWQSRCWGS